MKVVVFSEALQFFKMASALAQSLTEDTVGVFTQKVNFTRKLYLVDKVDEDGLVDFLSSTNFDLLVTGNVRRDRAIASRIAGRLKVGFVPDVTSIKVEGNKVSATRLAYSGMATAEVESSTPLVVTVSSFPGEPKEVESEVMRVELKGGKMKVLEVKRSSGGLSLATAQIVVGVGRGIGSKENVSYAQQLASALGGAVAGTRPVCAELGWLPEDVQVGLSGLRIRPKLYLALGISGQPQHIAGIKDSKVVVAVNKDENAPIAENADYFVVGDAVEFCKVFTEKIRKLKG